MDKFAQKLLDAHSPQEEWKIILLTAIINKYGENWRVPFVAGRNVLRAQPPNLDEQTFLKLVEEYMQNPLKGDTSLHRINA